jgi:hypothetical protein
MSTGDDLEHQPIDPDDLVPPDEDQDPAGDDEGAYDE